MWLRKKSWCCKFGQTRCVSFGERALVSLPKLWFQLTPEGRPEITLLENPLFLSDRNIISVEPTLETRLKTFGQRWKTHRSAVLRSRVVSVNHDARPRPMLSSSLELVGARL